MSLSRLQELSFDNREALGKSALFGCFFCISTDASPRIKKWTDNGVTALCPRCGIDAVLPGVTDTKLLAAMCERWFTNIAPSPAAEDIRTET